MNLSLPAIRPYASAWPIWIGLMILYLPTFWGLAHGIWTSDEQAHGPIVLVVSLFLLWQQRELLMAASDGKTNPVAGWSLLIFGLLLYALGRSQGILMFEIGSQIPVLFGVLLITHGSKVTRALAFPIGFLIFMVPLPGFLVDSLTGSLKAQVSVLAENILYFIGYPIARSGVTLSIGPYQLLVADACSGLHSIFSLSAMGLLYVYLIRQKWLHNVLLLLTVIPIAFMANVVRVMFLVLVTYYFGDEAGQGFAHQFAGIALFLVAILLLFVVDGVLGWALRKIRYGR